MPSRSANEPVARLVDPHNARTLEVLGPTVTYLTPPDAEDGEPCVMRGTIPPGVVVPLHSHADPETFLVVSGELEGLAVAPHGFAWVPVRPGDIFHIPGSARHAWRNTTREPAVTTIVTTRKMGRFFQEVGTPVRPATTSAAPPSEAEIQHFLETAERYGYWNASPEENAKVGLHLAGHDS
jgi:quercetin dioxygenase-like cupin family protein